MALDDATRDLIEQQINSHRVVLYMKGNPRQPMCGFSAKTAGLLDSVLEDYVHVDVMQDESIREGIKVYGQWPTIPQLYIDGELVGGCDIVTDMYNSGELHAMLGLEAPDRTPPEITITPKAAEKIQEAMEGHSGISLHLQVDPDFQARFQLAPAQGGEIAVSASGINVLFDVASAQRARGAAIDWVETMQGEGLSINLPEAPAAIPQLSVQELQALLEEERVLLVDVRSDEERLKASIANAQPMNAALMEQLESMPKDTALAFICHTGQRSQVAAEHFRRQGFSAVHNVTGGIDAWSKEIDPTVPTY
ncbi:MAG: Grx4 family monothiol glutaredoxin [Xanthomonadales bacterium]|nr:Grx4 family monothiol glutaredoxin [Xanthomonadales bacterium]